MESAKQKALPHSEALCRQCGLCCDGNLFADVLLQANEVDPIESAIGYEDRDGTFFLQQPCLAFCEGDCQIYVQRPQGCREFECDILKKYQQGKLDIQVAISTIEQAKQQISEVEELLTVLGESDHNLPLSQRIEAALSQAWDLTEPEAVQTSREALFACSTELAGFLESQFRLATPEA